MEKLNDKITSELAWRKKELIDFSTLIKSQSEIYPVLCKMGIALLSAHFEGAIKNISYYYLLYVSSQNKKCSELTENFAAILIRKILQDSTESLKITLYKKSATKILSDESFSIADNVIDTESNPTSKVVKDIFNTIGLDFSPYATKEKYIDTDMLSNRHKAVHGEHVNVSRDTFEETKKEILGFMDSFTNLILNAAEKQEFLKCSPEAVN
ncbi:MAG: hypothetical protein K6G09_10075 [Treponema sp.]|nr:hypothetical protein [Treponema sp.]